MRVFFILTLCTFSLAFAQDVPTESSPIDDEELFTEGVALYKAEKFEEAASTLKQVLKVEPNSDAAYYNLGLAEYRQGHRGLAVAYWRKALFLNPGLVDARNAIDFAETNLNWPRERPDGLWGLLHSELFSFISLDRFLVLLLLTGITFGWVLLGFFGKGKDALKADQTAPLPSTSLLLLGFLFLGSLTLTSMKAWDLGIKRATVVAPSVVARTGPGQNTSSLFELVEGSQVVVRESKDGWLKVQSSRGQVGWTEEQSVFEIN